MLDEDLDIRTFRIGNYGFSDFVKNVSMNQAIVQVSLQNEELHVVKASLIVVAILNCIIIMAGQCSCIRHTGHTSLMILIGPSKLS